MGSELRQTRAPVGTGQPDGQWAAARFPGVIVVGSHNFYCLWWRFVSRFPPSFGRSGRWMAGTAAVSGAARGGVMTKGAGNRRWSGGSGRRAARPPAWPGKGRNGEPAATGRASIRPSRTASGPVGSGAVFSRSRKNIHGMEGRRGGRNPFGSCWLPGAGCWSGDARGGWRFGVGGRMARPAVVAKGGRT